MTMTWDAAIVLRSRGGKFRGGGRGLVVEPPAVRAARSSRPTHGSAARKPVASTHLARYVDTALATASSLVLEGPTSASVKLLVEAMLANQVLAAKPCALRRCVSDAARSAACLCHGRGTH